MGNCGYGAKAYRTVKEFRARDWVRRTQRLDSRFTQNLLQDRVDRLLAGRFADEGCRSFEEWTSRSWETCGDRDVVSITYYVVECRQRGGKYFIARSEGSFTPAHEFGLSERMVNRAPPGSDSPIYPKRFTGRLDLLLGFSIKAGPDSVEVSHQHQSVSAKVAFSSLFIMRFSTIFTVLATGALAFAGSVPETAAKKNATDIQNPFTDLSHKCDTIIPKFDNCVDDHCSDEIVVELVTAINGSTNALDGLPGGPSTPDLATVVSDVVTVSVGKYLGLRSTHTPFQKITRALDAHKTGCGPKCPSLMNTYAKLDPPFSLCLKAAFNLAPGLPPLVAPR